MRWTDAVWTRPKVLARGLGLLRVVVGLLFIAHGLQKILAFPSPMTGLAVAVTSMVGIAGIIETVGGALIIAGLFTRPVAFVLSGEMAVAYFTQHAPKGFSPLANGGELALLYCFLFLFFAIAGGGAWSIDSIRYSAHRAWASEEDV